MGNNNTKENFKEFYKEIKPLIGGGVNSVIANKFDKANLYSEEEQIIGRWIDDKPIYQKTVNYTLPTAEGYQEYTYLSGIPFGEIDEIIGMDGWALRKDGWRVRFAGMNIWYYIDWNKGTSKLYFYVNNSGNGTAGQPATITLQYTKTTDEAIAICSDTDYSTTEKIVGTWIDGKPLYQKTIDCGALPNATTKQIAHNITNADMMRIVDSFAFSSGNVIPIPFSTTKTADSVSIEVQKAGNIKIACAIDYSGFSSSYVTLQYTKTTDEYK